jgi:hypothetical protein
MRIDDGDGDETRGGVNEPGGETGRLEVPVPTVASEGAPPEVSARGGARGLGGDGVHAGPGAALPGAAVEAVPEVAPLVRARVPLVEGLGT